MTFAKVQLKRLVDPTRPITYGIVQAGPNTPGGIPYIRPVDMTPYSGIVAPTSLLRTTPEIAAAYQRATVTEGDVVISIGPSYGKVMVVNSGLAGANLTQGTARVAPGPGVHNRFLYWVLQSSEARQHWDSCVGGATFRALNLEPLGRTPVPLAPSDEQRRIADFLDAETARIDGILRARTEQLDLLQGRRAALKTQCVTYNGPDAVPHPILGSLSPDWKVVPLRRVLPAINVGVVINPSHYFADSGVPFIHGFNVREGFISMTGMKYMTTESNEAHQRSKVYAGDVLVVRAGATAGRASMVGEEFNGANCASVLILRKSEAVHPKYLEEFINSLPGKGQVSFSQYGAAQEVISAGQVGSFLMSVPPLKEQADRLARLESATARTVTLEGKLQRQVRLLQERRRSLITAAVTGQFDVTTASGRNVTEGVSA